MPEQRKGTAEKTGRATEKTVHDLTKHEDLTRVLDQSLRALQEMEQRLQLLEQELGSIGVRPGQSAGRLHPYSGSGGQYIGAPNPHSGNLQFLMNPLAQGQHQPQAAQFPMHALPEARLQAPPFQAAPFQAAPFQTSPLAAARAIHPGAAGWGGMPFQAGATGMAATARFPPGAVQGPAGDYNPEAGSAVSQAMQVGQPDLSPEGAGTRTKDFAEMTPQVRQPTMDVVDCNTEFLIHWELPGVKKDNLDIMVTDKSLILNAKALPELDEGFVVHSERPPVVYRRTIPFQTDVDTSGAKASLKDGVLTVHVPKRTPSNGPKRLDVAYG